VKSSRDGCVTMYRYIWRHSVPVTGIPVTLPDSLGLLLAFLCAESDTIVLNTAA
jgi:hypothetical protein